MTLPHRPSDTIRAARRSIDGQPCVGIITDLQWFEPTQTWALLLRLTPEVSPTGSFPKATDWFVTIPESYPSGPVKVFPAKDGGITETYPHQNNNRAGKPDMPWRCGDLCLATTAKGLGIYGADAEPYDAHSRLNWHIQRALEWITDASYDRLAPAGDPFELPHYPTVGPSKIIFSTFPEKLWPNAPANSGVVKFLRRENRKELLVKTFLDFDGAVLHEFRWGNYIIDRFSEIETGIWLRLPSVPIVPPWAAPTTWQELETSLHRQRLDLERALRRPAGHVRDGTRHYLLLGFPIPDTIGGTAVALHWQGIRLPVLSVGKTPVFRETKEGYWKRDLLVVLRGELEWVESENWGSDQIGARGRFQSELISAPIFIVGAGAIGSVVGELLVRGGAEQITVCDPDKLAIGNLARHTLTLSDLDRNKAIELSRRLSAISPHVVCTAIEKDFKEAAGTEQLAKARLILDCTGSDTVLVDLHSLATSVGRIFASISVGFGAKRLFLYLQRDRFDANKFRSLLRPWLTRQLEERGPEPLPREGTGCWHSLFPARFDATSLMSAAALRSLASRLETLSPDGELHVFEEKTSDNHFGGIVEVGSEPEG